jgi:hypothetical protein
MLWNGMMYICGFFSNKCEDSSGIARFKNYGKIEWLFLENMKSWNNAV